MVSFRRTHYRISLRRFFARGAYRQEWPTGQRGLLGTGAYWPQGEALAPVASPLATPLGYNPALKTRGYAADCLPHSFHSFHATPMGLM